jgi:diamine N-acetyltransferase
MQIKIRPLKRSDAFKSYLWRNDPEVWKYTGSKPDKTITVGDEVNWINHVLSEKNSKRFAIIADGEYIGNIQLTDLNSSEGVFHIFIGNRSYWGRGAAKKATLLILSYAFLNLKLAAIKLRVRLEHIVAYKLYSIVGFKEVKRNDDFIFMEITAKDFF